jgi:hypothetical protein
MKQGQLYAGISKIDMRKSKNAQYPDGYGAFLIHKLQNKYNSGNNIFTIGI